MRKLPVWCGTRSLLHLQRQRSNTWIDHLEGLGTDEEQYCRDSHTSMERLNRIPVMNGGAPELLKKLFGLLQVKDVTPLRLSQQYEAQEHLHDKVFYVPWRLAMPLLLSSGGDNLRLARGLAKC